MRDEGGKKEERNILSARLLTSSIDSFFGCVGNFWRQKIRPDKHCLVKLRNLLTLATSWSAALHVTL